MTSGNSGEGVEMKAKACLFITVFISLVALSAPSVWAQAYPNRTIEIITRNTPGGSSDVLARMIAEAGTRILGQPMVVVNKPGAAGSASTADVIASKPDGYKILQNAHDYFAITVHTMKVPFNPDDLVPLANFMSVKTGLLVRGDSPIKSFEDFIARVRKDPDGLKLADTGRGTPPSLALDVIMKQATGAIRTRIPFKGTTEMIAALLGGHVEVATAAYGPAMDQIKAGKLRLLAVYDEKRYKESPNVPNIVELGFPKAWFPGFFGLYIHRNTPEPIKKTLLDACKKMYDEPEFQKGIERLNADPLWGGPEFLTEKIKKLEAASIPLLKELGMYVEK
jgi:tripartite-type tricarboxylate transporter receptor subunit TctC